MKQKYFLQQAGMMSVFLFGFGMNLSSQEQPASQVNAGGDFVSNYIWRGTKLGSGPAIQPFVELSMGNLSVGAWGSYSFSTDEAAEADLYISYSFDFGLSLGITDYYFPGTQYFDFSQNTGAHGYEINLGYSFGSLGLAANYMLNQAGAAGTKGGDMYFETTYSFTSVTLFIGGGDGWHTSTGNFAVCNIGVSAVKSVKLNDIFSFPLKGSVILNPERQQFYVVLGVSL